MWITRISISNPVFATMVMVGITVLGLFSYNRLRVEQMPDVSLPFVLVHDDLPGRGARGGRDRRHQAARVRGQPGLRRQADPLATRARGRARSSPSSGSSTDVDGGDAGRARQDRDRAPDASRATSRIRWSSAPTTRTSSRSSRSRCCRRRSACASSRRSPTRRSSRRSRTCPASRASTSTAA